MADTNGETSNQNIENKESNDIMKELPFYPQNNSETGHKIALKRRLEIIENYVKKLGIANARKFTDKISEKYKVGERQIRKDFKWIIGNCKPGDLYQAKLDLKILRDKTLSMALLSIESASTPAERNEAIKTAWVVIEKYRQDLEDWGEKEKVADKHELLGKLDVLNIKFKIPEEFNELQIEPTKKQAIVWKKLFDNETKFILFGGGAGGGKSWLICEWLMYMCLTYPKTKYFIGRKELKRLMSSTFLTLMKVLDKHGIGRDRWKLNGQYNYVEFFNGSRIDLLDVDLIPSDPMFQRFGSIEYTSGALEEAGEISFGAFDTLKTRIGRHYNHEYSIPSKILLTCNPSKNWTYREFYKPWSESKLPNNITFIQSLYNDNPYTVSEYGENLKLISDKSQRERLMLGNWEYEDDPMKLFDYNKILDMFTNNAERGQKYCIVDMAGLGRDKTVISFWDGFFVTEIMIKENSLTAKELDEMLTKRMIPSSNCLIDETGVGFGIVHELTDQKGIYKRNVQGFVAAASPIKKDEEKEIDKVQHNYKNLRCQCWFTLANYVNSGMIGITQGISMEIKKLVIEDLEQMKQKNADQDGKLQVITKEEIKEQGGLNRSTDCGDVLMMRMFYTFQKRNPIVSKIMTLGSQTKPTGMRI